MQFIFYMRVLSRHHWCDLNVNYTCKLLTK